MDIGKRIKQLRLRNNLTLEELASRTELTKGFLSQLERNLTSPSIQTLEDVVEALGTTMSKFFTEDTDEKIVFGSKDEFTDEQDNEIIHWIVPNAQKNLMEPVILELNPGAESMNIDPHEGEELGYVLSGRLFLIRERDRKGTMIKKGETFYIRGSESHHLENRSDKTASVLWISTPPAF
ncbi:MAG: cupin domain-containing protein [Erysipelotrichia bacterium]|nr:cupin domain-containing protein [Erysipelotrichia bacterium]